MRKLPALDEGTQPSRHALISGGVGAKRAHESAENHVTGAARYVDDRPRLSNQLHAAIGKSSIAKGRIKSIDLSKVVSAAGVIEVVTAKDVPGNLDIGPVFPGDPVLAILRF